MDINISYNVYNVYYNIYTDVYYLLVGINKIVQVLKFKRKKLVTCNIMFVLSY